MSGCIYALLELSRVLLRTGILYLDPILLVICRLGAKGLDGMVIREDHWEDELG
jgi:hypothetical protein